MIGDIAAIARESLVTAAGGLGRIDPSAASATFNFAHRLSYLISWIASGQHAGEARAMRREAKHEA